MQQPDCPLNPRDKKIVELLSVGMNVKQIAREMKSTPYKVEAFIDTAKRRAGGGRTAAALVAKAIREGWVK